jgi:TPR repeat protein
MKFNLLMAFWMLFASTIASATTLQRDSHSQRHNTNAALNITKQGTGKESSSSSKDKLDLLAEGQAAFNAHEYEKAFKLWHNLAQQGHIEAQVFVGLAYKNGWGVEKDPLQASMWFQMAAEGGNPSAQFFVGLHYLSSDNPKLVPIGVDWLVKAAHNGESSARQFLLKAKRRQWFEVPDNFEVSTRVTQVTANNIDQVFAGTAQSSKPDAGTQHSQ